MAAHRQSSQKSAARELVEAGGGRIPHEPGGSVRTALANAMVGMKKQFYGRGPTAAKAWILDDYVFVVMEGGLTRNEETRPRGRAASGVVRPRRPRSATPGSAPMTIGGDGRPQLPGQSCWWWSSRTP